MAGEHILIVEDEPDIAAILRDYLIREGYTVTLMDRGEKVVAFVKSQNLSIILLDIMLPGVDGKTICREIRKFSEVPILMITAKVEEVDRIIGFELGADDYVCKPFSPREVVVRVKAILRRSLGQTNDEILSRGPMVLNRSSRGVTVNNCELNLTPSEFDILSILMESPNRVFTRTQLIETVQGYNYDGYDRTIDFHIKNLRKKIAVHLPGRKIIQSSYGIGYKLVI
ncbi:two-component system response regulator BaeR [Desulfobacter hydrogenophilus]|uniref:Response regulator n=1 Tax=Desulfobacter hydrogenophilus TaxID=2291 RepID=A0A328FC97_9BACT|nr:response regulator [Desulfobacter hydrogenophilus]NDY73550.1 response regulator [Desulfobacter hydrogenophilus]QBH14361.1 response regulator [Desulfobacter hydrogenophilus]RAM02314.1 two-component system response regulator BaeR [Desulfobacter hydrogenophilus]